MDLLKFLADYVLHIDRRLHKIIINYLTMLVSMVITGIIGASLIPSNYSNSGKT